MKARKSPLLVGPAESYSDVIIRVGRIGGVSLLITADLIE
jgi:hypothetical protein